MPEATHFIGNQWVAPARRAAGSATSASAVNAVIPVIDPSDGQPFTDIARGDAEDIDRAVQAARAAFEGDWGRTSAAERGRVLHGFASLLARHQEDLAQREARDTGKPLKQARADAAAIVRYFEFYAGAADKLHGETIPYQQGFTVFTLRGVSQFDFSDHQESPVAVFVDGSYVPYLSAVGASLFDLDHVEVLRGPQGTLFGRNATGGVIQVVSARPTEAPSGYAMFQAGDHGQLHAEGAVSGPIGGGVLGRLSLSDDQHDGYFKNTAYAAQKMLYWGGKRPYKAG